MPSMAELMRNSDRLDSAAVWENEDELKRPSLRSGFISAARYFKKKRVRKRKLNENMKETKELTEEIGSLNKEGNGKEENEIVFEEIELKKRFFYKRGIGGKRDE